MNLFESVTPASPDPILGLNASFREDPRPDKVNLTVGVYKDGTGESPVLESVRKAEERLAANLRTKSYLPIEGSPEFLAATQDLVFGTGNEMLSTQRVASFHTPGGTGALRLTGEFLRNVLNRRSIWISRPTWANHPGIFAACGLECKEYPYMNTGSHELNRPGFFAVLEDIPPNDPVLFHACCHNPTGIDPTGEDWRTIAKICKARELLPIVDFAYQGFANGLVKDASALRAFSEVGLEFIVASSFSKNFGLYQDRVGALHVVAKNQDEADRIRSQIKILVRRNYSNPAAHGGAIVSTILHDHALKQQWEEELHAMRVRIQEMREALVEALQQIGAPGDFSFIRDQQGMFSFTGLSPEQVQKCRDDFGIYIVDSGRINVAGLNAGNLSRVAEAFKAVRT